MEPQKDLQIAPAIIQAILAQATARGLSVNDYLAELLGLNNGHEKDSESFDGDEQSLTPYELAKDYIGSIDSSVPEPNAKPHKTLFGEGVAEKLRKQGLIIP